MKQKSSRTALILLIAVLVWAFSGCGSASEKTAPVVINEVMSSNSSYAPAGDGECYDWIELYNPNDKELDLDGWFITDNDSKPLKFRLRGMKLAPHGYELIYLSGINGMDADGRLHANFRLSSTKGETLMLSDEHGSVVARLEIPESGNNVSYGRVTDDSGESVYHWFSAPTPCAENVGDHASNAADLVFGTNGVIINEFMTSNKYMLYDADGDYGDWIELYNPGSEPADISRYALTDDIDKKAKYPLPEGTVLQPGEYMIVYCDGKDKQDTAGIYHANFSIGDEDEILALYSDQGATCTEITLTDLPDNVSCGYLPGTDQLKLFSRPTPGTENSPSGYELDDHPLPDINRGVYISETLSASGASAKWKSDFIEIYNSTSEDIELGGYTLAEAPGEAEFSFPETMLPSGGYTVVYCDGDPQTENDDGLLHASIRLGTDGGEIYLAEPDGRVCDCFRAGRGEYGVSCGRAEGDLANRRFFVQPTPGESNSAESYSGYTEPPLISPAGGYAEKGTEVTISAPAGCEIYYTTDGSEPDSSSKKYDGAIELSRTAVIRAAAVKPGYLMSRRVSETYFVTEPHSLPIVSLSAKNTDLFGDSGMVTEYDKDVERKAHIEYYDENGVKGVEFDCGLSIFGETSRKKDQKGFKLMMREIYGSKEVTYPFFPDSVSGVSTFSSLLLRPDGQDQNRAKLRDELVVAILRGQMDIDYQEYRACALYINGSYYGLYYIRERLDAGYIERKYDVQKDSFDLIKAQSSAQVGTMDEWIALDRYCQENDLTIKENYDYVCSQVDIDSLINFWIVETYFANADTGNIRCYKTDGGKWRWMVYDFDWAMSNPTWTKDYVHGHLLDPDGHGAIDLSNAVIRKLLENDEFRDKFLSEYCYHLNNTFAPERTQKLLEELNSSIEQEMPRQQKRWAFPKEDDRQDNLKLIRKFLDEKPELAKEQLKENFGLSDAEIKRYTKEKK